MLKLKLKQLEAGSDVKPRLYKLHAVANPHLLDTEYVHVLHGGIY